MWVIVAYYGFYAIVTPSIVEKIALIAGDLFFTWQATLNTKLFWKNRK